MVNSRGFLATKKVIYSVTSGKYININKYPPNTDLCLQIAPEYPPVFRQVQSHSCFYCGTVINSNSDLQDHLRVFIQVIESLNLNQDIDSIQCDECTAEFVVQKI